MQNLSNQKISKFSLSFLLTTTLIVLAGCGSGTPSGTTDTGGTGGTTVTTTTLVPTPTLTMVMTNGGAPVNSISNSAPATVTATVKDASGVPVQGVVVTFSVTDPTLATITPANTRLTQSNGTASVTLSPANNTAAGATTITATAQVTTAGVTTTVNGSAGFSVGSAAAPSLTISNPIFGVNPLSAFGTTSVQVTVYSSGVPVTSAQTVTFSSTCGTSGKAALTVSAQTAASGVATGSYRDINCGSTVATDTVVASVNGITSSAVLTVTPPAVGSIKFISATPTSITLKGTGGAGRQESSIVIFRVVDANNNPVQNKTVTFSLNTSVGGITLTNGTAISDAGGNAQTTVNSGNVSTAVRVNASTPGTVGTLTTQSDQLVITTGIPDQDSFSLSATTFNIEGWTVDGTTTELTARLADHFNNPPPDGTAVTFTTEGGKVVSSCLTLDGACSATLNSQALRPKNGRVTVLAYAVGEESFTDLNGDGWADANLPPSTAPTELVDANGASTDMAEAFVDYNENGVWNLPASGVVVVGEPFIDYNSSGAFDPADTKFNGVLCDESVTPGSSAGTCSATKSLHIRDSLVIVFSGSFATMDITPASAVFSPPCTDGVSFVPATIPISATIYDVNGNSMPAGSTVTFATDNGTLSTPSTFTVPNTIACLDSFSACPTGSAIPTGTGALTYRVFLKSDATQDASTKVCTNPIRAGTLTITIKTPLNNSTSYLIQVTD